MYWFGLGWKYQSGVTYRAPCCANNKPLIYFRLIYVRLKFSVSLNENSMISRIEATLIQDENRRLAFLLGVPFFVPLDTLVWQRWAGRVVGNGAISHNSVLPFSAGQPCLHSPRPPPHLPNYHSLKQWDTLGWSNQGVRQGMRLLQ